MIKSETIKTAFIDYNINFRKSGGNSMYFTGIRPNEIITMLNAICTDRKYKFPLKKRNSSLPFRIPPRSPPLYFFRGGGGGGL